MKFKNLIGLRFGRLVVVEKSHNKNGSWFWKCDCDCGNVTTLISAKLNNKNTRSCGCLLRETTSKTFKIHGLCLSKEYGAYNFMKNRCYNKKRKGYKNWGGRGITVCDRWLESFQNFIDDMGKAPTSKHSLDRIENDKGYYKENCRWATRIEQANNTRRSVYLEYSGLKMTISEWSKKMGISDNALRGRIYKGWPTEKALTTPSKTRL